MRRASILLALLLAGAAIGQTVPQAQEGDEIVWHTVRPGETLEEITRKYLGTPRPWPDNWRLNPDIPDPHKLTPGQRIRVIKHRVAVGRAADVSKVEKRVERKPHPAEWISAKEGDRLNARDGIRTYERSSAQLDFDDGSTLVLSESSLVFLKEAGRLPSGVNRQSLEIVEGQSDLKAPLARGRSSEIEIVLGGSKARPETDKPSQSRARMQKGEAQLMVYSGKTELSTGEARVSVSEGMGSTVPKGGAPSTPELLLPAPETVSPTAAQTLDFANPLFVWRAVPKAARYVVDVCLDAGCGRLVGKREVSGTEATVEGLPQGALHWRVAAVSASGLDGYVAAAVPFTIRGGEDVEPPAVAVAPSGTAKAVGPATIVLGESGRLVVSAVDDVSGVAEVRYRWDEGAWESFAGAPIQAPSGPGPFKLSVSARDRSGRESAPLQITVTH